MDFNGKCHPHACWLNDHPHCKFFTNTKATKPKGLLSAQLQHKRQQSNIGAAFVRTEALGWRTLVLPLCLLINHKLPSNVCGGCANPY